MHKKIAKRTLYYLNLDSRRDIVTLSLSIFFKFNLQKLTLHPESFQVHLLKKQHFSIRLQLYLKKKKHTP